MRQAERAWLQPSWAWLELMLAAPGTEGIEAAGDPHGRTLAGRCGLSAHANLSRKPRSRRKPENWETGNPACGLVGLRKPLGQAAAPTCSGTALLPLPGAREARSEVGGHLTPQAGPSPRGIDGILYGKAGAGTKPIAICAASHQSRFASRESRGAGRGNPFCNNSVAEIRRPGGMRACPAGSPVKAHALVVAAGFQHPASAVAPRGT